jgi:hypothetical protein
MNPGYDVDRKKAEAKKEKTEEQCKVGGVVQPF